MMLTLAEARSYLRTRGFRGAFEKALASYVAGRQTWYLTIEDLTHWVDAPVAATGLEIRAARRDDLPHMQRFHARQPAAVLESWLGADYFFFIALSAGDPITYRCVSTRVHPALLDSLALNRDQLFMVDEFTDPPYRRRGITRQIAIATNAVLMDHGYRQVIGIHRPDNRDTIAATRAKNIPTVATVRRYRLGPKSWVTYEAHAGQRSALVTEQTARGKLSRVTGVVTG